MSTIEPEVTIQSEMAFEGKLIQVRKDTVRIPGEKTTTREIVVHPEVVGILPLLDDGRIVFVRQYRKAADEILLEVPAGGIDEGERAEDAVRREMVEETGYRARTLEHLMSFYTSPGFTTELMHLYKAMDLTPGEPTEETDQIEVELITPEEALRLVRSGAIRDAKTILAVLVASYEP